MSSELNDKAIESMRKAIENDPDNELLYMDLAQARKKQGKLEFALKNYDAAAEVLARRIVKGMRNDRSSRIFKHLNLEHQLWVEYCMFGALYLAASDGNIENMSWPTGAFAMEEERTERHEGLYWVDSTSTDGKRSRIFLPNYFNTFRETLRQDRAYADLIGGRGTVLEELGRHEEAALHFAEAEYFLP